MFKNIKYFLKKASYSFVVSWLSFCLVALPIVKSTAHADGLVPVLPNIIPSATDSIGKPPLPSLTLVETGGGVCELPGVAIALGVTYAGFMTTFLLAFFAAMGAYVHLTVTSSALFLLNGLDFMRMNIVYTMEEIWDQWKDDLRNKTRQINVAYIDQTRNIGSFIDAANQVQAKSLNNKIEIQSVRRNRPGENSCVFDTLSQARGKGEEISKAIQRGLETDLVNDLTNNINVAAGDGSFSDLNKRWSDFERVFCDDQANAGMITCTTPGNPMKNRDIEVSKTIFGEDTIDVVNNTDNVLAVKTIVHNILNKKVMPSIKAGELRSAPGKEQLLNKRSYIARMSVPAAAISNVIGDRISSGEQSDELKKLREASGIPTNEIEQDSKPSKREIRQALVEKLWSPRHYISLEDSPEQAMAEYTQTKAQNLMGLYEMINKTELLGSMLSVELGMMLEDMKPDNASSFRSK